MKSLLLVAAIAAGTTVAATAEARDGQRGARMKMPSFEQLDVDGNGSITLEEIETARTAAAEARFAEADFNGDGALSADELLAQADANRDARRTARAEQQIEKLDSNGDGVLQADELAARTENRRAPSPDRMFDRVDADNDGAISAEELEEAHAEMEDRRGRRGGEQRGRRGNH